MNQSQKLVQILSKSGNLYSIEIQFPDTLFNPVIFSYNFVYFFNIKKSLFIGFELFIMNLKLNLNKNSQMLELNEFLC